ncbi:MAG: DUF169 domain-containing protein [Candidatus Zixiibacteriota bacterium]
MTNAEFAATIERHIRPATFPVAVKMLKEDDPIPERAKRPKDDLGFESAVCQAIGLARRYGWTLAVGTEDISCPITKAFFGFEKRVPYLEEGHACAGMYTESPEAGARTEASIPRFEYGSYRYLVVGPLARIDYEWDAAVIYGNSAQIMRLVTGALYKGGGAMTSQTAGRVDCADLVIGAMQSGECQFVLPCYGDRIFGGTTDDEMAFSLPPQKVDELVAGLEGTHKGGVRYPIPSFLRFTGQFPESYRKLEEFWV